MPPCKRNSARSRYWRNTRRHALLGLLVVPLVAFASGFLIVMSMLLGEAIHAGSLVGVTALILFSVVAAALTFVAVRSDCTRRPGSPIAIAIAYALGTLALGVLPTLDRFHWSLTALTLAFGLLQTLAAFFGARRASRLVLGKRRHGIGLTCAHCSYNLAATPDLWPCPECGGLTRYEHAPPE